MSNSAPPSNKINAQYAVFYQTGEYTGPYNSWNDAVVAAGTAIRNGEKTMFLYEATPMLPWNCVGYVKEGRVEYIGE